MNVKIIIRRSVPEETREALYPLLKSIREIAVNQTGYISGETLQNFENPEDLMVISSWRSIEAWKQWETNAERKEIQDRIDLLLNKETEYGIYYYV